MKKLIPIRITVLNHSTCNNEVVAGKIDRIALECFYCDTQGWIIVECESPMIIYKFDIEEIYDCFHDEVIIIDKERLREHLEPIYYTGI